MNRIYHHHEQWEDYLAGMYRRVSPADREGHVASALETLGNLQTCYDAMKQVTAQWNIACEHNLTNFNQNRRAWLGWAACAIVANVPYKATCEAWGLLSDQQRQQANALADTVIKLWETQQGPCPSAHSASLF